MTVGIGLDYGLHPIPSQERGSSGGASVEHPGIVGRWNVLVDLKFRFDFDPTLT
jgi:hypothetical protein